MGDSPSCTRAPDWRARVRPEEVGLVTPSQDTALAGTKREAATADIISPWGPFVNDVREALEKIKDKRRI